VIKQSILLTFYHLKPKTWVEPRNVIPEGQHLRTSAKHKTMCHKTRPYHQQGVGERVSSFLTRRTTNFSLVHKLQEVTYTTYKKVWKKLLSFVYRRVWRNQGLELSYRLTDAQVTALDQVMQAAAELCQEQQSRSLASAQLQQSLDYATI
jgi:hypothetical protein